MSDRKILKTTLTLTVLHHEDIDIANMSIDDIAYQIGDGESIGDMKTVSTEPVPADKVQEELLAIGNDGSFFDGLDDQDVA